MGRYTAGGVGRDLLAGAIAGAFAVWVLDKVDWKMYRAGGPDRIRRTEAARPGGMDPAHVMANRAATKVGVDIGDPKDNPAGHAIHYGLGIGMGALYGLLRGMSPAVATGRGALFGLAAWIIQDEGMNTWLGTAGRPLDYPWQDHARGAAAHTVFGISTDLITRILSPWRNRVVIEQGPPLQERIASARDQAQFTADQARQRLATGWDQASTTAQSFASQARDRFGPTLSDAGHRARAMAEQARDRAGPAFDDASDRAQRIAEQARRRAGPAFDDASDRARRVAKQARRRWGPAVDQAVSQVQSIRPGRLW